MSSRTTTWIARGLGLLALGLLAAGWSISGVGDFRSDVFISALAVVFSAVGVLVASRHPGNATGWLFIGVGVATGLGTLAGSYADAWVAGGGYDGSRRLGEAAAWYGTQSWIPFILVPCTFVLLLFPDGRLLSPRWRWVAWCAGAGVAGRLPHHRPRRPVRSRTTRSSTTRSASTPRCSTPLGNGAFRAPAP